MESNGKVSGDAMTFQMGSGTTVAKILAVLGGISGGVSALYFVAIGISIGATRRLGYSAAAAPGLETMIPLMALTGTTAIILTAPYVYLSVREGGPPIG